MKSRFALLVAASVVALTALESTARADSPPGDSERAPPPSLTGAAALALPIGNLSNAFNVGLGASLAFAYPVHPKVAVLGRGGFMLHFPKSGADVSFNVVPIHGGARVGFTGLEQGPFAEATAGPNVIFSSVNTGLGGTASDSTVKLGLDVAGGYRISKFDFAGHAAFYDLGHAGDTMALMVTVGYSFASF